MKEVDPQNTSRNIAFELWMKAPMPMVTSTTPTLSGANTSPIGSRKS